MASYMAPRPGVLAVSCALVSVLCWQSAQGSPLLSPRKPRHAHPQIGAHLTGPSKLVLGSPAAYRVVIHWTDAPGVSEPLANAVLKLELWRASRKIATLTRARSDAAGEAALIFTVPRASAGSYTLVLSARSSFAKTEERLKVELMAGARAHLTVEKPLYRPGQVVRVRALVLGNVGRKPLVRKLLAISLADPRGTQIARHQIRTSAFGIAATEFVLAHEVNLGQYTVQATLAAEKQPVGQRHFKVQRYELPSFEVKVSGLRKHYRPGQLLRGTVSARRFTGKGVVQAQVQLKVSTWRCPDRRSRRCDETVETHPLTTDSRGEAVFSLRLPKERRLPMAKGGVDVRATVVDMSGERREGVKSAAFSVHAFRVALWSAGGSLWMRGPTDVHVVALKSSGERMTRGNAVLRDARGVAGRASLDRLGTASIAYRPRGKPNCRVGGGRGFAVTVQVRDGRGRIRALERCLPVGDQPLRALVRQPLVQRAESIDLGLVAPGAKDGVRALVDVIKEGQIIATKQVALKAGAGRITLKPSAELSGLLSLRVSLASHYGKAHRVAVYLQAPVALKVRGRLDRASYAPGGTAKLTLEVREQHSNRPVQAALGLRGVDKALLSLVKERSDSAELFFALARYARSQTKALRLTPGGGSLAHWLRSKAAKALRQRATYLLLSAIRPPEVPYLQSDPWGRRREQWKERAERLMEAGQRAIYRLRLGRKNGPTWTFRTDLVRRLVDAGYAKKGDLRDPWGRDVTPPLLQKVDREFLFARLAESAAHEKLEKLYQIIERKADGLGLRRIPLSGLKRKELPLRLPQNLLRKLNKHPRFAKRWLLYDPWGRSWQIKHHRKHVLERISDRSFASQQEILSVGPDGKLGTEDDVRLDFHRQPIEKTLLATLCLMGRCSKACGVCGGFGYGRGGGRMGGRRGAVPRIIAGSSRVMGAHPGGHPDRPGLDLRSDFSETLLWRPEVITDHRGRAELIVPLPHGITTYRIFANALSRDGLFGSTELDLKVFQPFYVDVQLPLRVHSGDAVTASVLVHNHTRSRQQVTLKFTLPAGVSTKGGLERKVSLPAKGTKHLRLPLRFGTHGLRALVVRAEGRDALGQLIKDAVRREVEVRPYGAEVVVFQSGTLRSGGRGTSWNWAMPPGIISRTERVRLSFDAGPVQQSLDGLESLLRRPHGCFEQTSSTVYPNILILDHLRRARRNKPAIEKKARAYLAQGYQRLLTFEVKGGGFSWFGRAPANQVLTAYGLMEFADMARLRFVDPKLLRRTSRWLMRRQKADGSWGADKLNFLDGAVNNVKDHSVSRTAYIVRALIHAGIKGKSVRRGLRYLRAHVDELKQPYAMALVLDTLGRVRRQSKDQAQRLEKLAHRLWRAHRVGKKGTFIPGPMQTLTYGGGGSADVEATALAAQALLRVDAIKKVDTLVQALVKRRNPRGGWSTTQGTILALQALLRHGELVRPARGWWELFIDGRRRHRRHLVAGKGKSVSVDLSPELALGRHQVRLRFTGKGVARFRLVGRGIVPFEQHKPTGLSNLAVQGSFRRPLLMAGEATSLRVSAHNKGRTAVPMVMVSVPLPPGVQVATGVLANLTRLPRVQKVQLIDGAVTLYLDRLGPGKSLALAIPIQSKLPLAVRLGPATIWEYYRPENRSVGKPLELRVR